MSGMLAGGLDAAVAQTYSNEKKIHWMKSLLGKSKRDIGSLPEETLRLAENTYGNKRPLTTNWWWDTSSWRYVKFDLYVCLRPVRWFEGVPSPDLIQNK